MHTPLFVSWMYIMGMHTCWRRCNEDIGVHGFYLTAMLDTVHVVRVRLHHAMSTMHNV